MTAALQIFLAFAKVAALTFGGGYAMIPLFQDEIVTRLALMPDTDFANLVGLAMVTPGPVGLNSATYAGVVTGGLRGAVAATLGVMVPSLTFTLVVAVFLRRISSSKRVKDVFAAIRPAVVGLFAAAVLFFAKTSVFESWQGAAVFAAILLLHLRWKMNVFAALALSGALGYLLYLPF